MSRCQLIVTSCVWKNYCGSPWGHTICYSVHKSAVSEVMQCWWLCCRADGRREVGDSFWTSGWLVRARSEQLPKFAHRRFQDQSSRFSRRWAGSNFLDRIVRGLCIHIYFEFWQQYQTTLMVLFSYLPSAGCSLVINIHFCFGGFFRIFPLMKDDMGGCDITLNGTIRRIIRMTIYKWIVKIQI